MFWFFSRCVDVVSFVSDGYGGRLGFGGYVVNFVNIG